MMRDHSDCMATMTSYTEAETRKHNHGNQDQPPLCYTEVSGIFPISGQRKCCRVLQTNSWWQQITKGNV